MKTFAVGDLVRINKSGLRSLDFVDAGLGHITRVVPNSGYRPVVYVCWFSDGYTKPISTAWLEKINESR